MEKIIRLFVCLVLLSPGLTESAAANSCGANAYVDEIIIEGETRTIVCACLPGFERVNQSCERTIPADLLEYATFFLPAAIMGEVDVFWEHDGQKKPVSTEHMFYANAVVVGASSQFTAYLDNEMRLRLSANTELRLGELLPDTMMAINALRGTLRLDNHLDFEQKEWVKKALGKIKVWSKRVLSSRMNLTVRGTAAMAVRGTDILMHGRENGDITVEVIDGEIELTSLLDGSIMTGLSGNAFLITADGKSIEKIK